MRKLNAFALLLVTLFTLTLSGCKDDDEDMSPNTTTLTQKEWQGDGIYVRGTALTSLLQLAGEPDLADEVDITDWRFKFNKDGSFTGTSDIYSGTGKWRFEDNEQTLVLIDEDNAEQRFDINSLTSNQLYLEANVEDFGYDPDELFGITTFEVRLKR